MFDYVILILCAYLAYSNFSTLLEVPFSEWELVQWLLLLVTLGIIAVAVFRAYYMVQKARRKREESAEAATEAAEDEKADAALDEAAGTDGPVVVTMKDLEHLDEIDLGDDE